MSVIPALMTSLDAVDHTTHSMAHCGRRGEKMGVSGRRGEKMGVNGKWETETGVRGGRTKYMSGIG